MADIPHKHKALNRDVKFQIISAVNAGKKSKKEIADEFGVPKSTLDTIIKQRQSIIYKFQLSEYGAARKRFQSSANKDVDALFEWFNAVRSKNIPWSGHIIISMAKEFAEKLGHSDFSASTGWLERLKKRHGTCSSTTLGESASVDPKLVDDWLTSQLPTYLTKFNTDDIFNDGHGLFYRLVPQRTLNLKGEKCHSGKKSKERITLLVASNMTGTERLKLSVNGKSVKPSCFKNV
ncbi:tigger transposable element-derived protein 4-like [Haliotis rufescens]|uniref:tigger transposable element-derived protein 4-like n=1 Tax=Haliotis rufescens TaxID=6454 RepID=UPI00201E922F|nr:tigger transposable element-derived protein 4-like [Haliotis rufescens]